MPRVSRLVALLFALSVVVPLVATEDQTILGTWGSWHAPSSDRLDPG